MLYFVNGFPSSSIAVNGNYNLIGASIDLATVTITSVP
jgi:hypothetical protein